MNEEAEILIDRLKNLTDQISFLLDSQDDFDQYKINNLDALYGERKKIIDQISVFSVSIEGRAFFLAASDYWNQAISAIKDKERNNINRIKEILKQKESGLRALISQKSLLIYSKDESNGY